MPDGFKDWVNWQTFAGAAFAAVVGAVMKLLQVLIRDKTDRYKLETDRLKLKVDEATEIRKELRERVKELETRLDESAAACLKQVTDLRREYEEKITKLETENENLRLKLIRLDADVCDVREKTAEFMLPRKEHS